MTRADPRLIIFDLDNTLVDRDRFFREWVDTIVAVWHLDPVKARRVLIGEDDDGRADRSTYFEKVRARLGISESVALLTAAFWKDQLARYRCDEPTIQSLMQLRKSGYRLGIATNGGQRQIDKVGACRLGMLVDAVVTSEAVGAAKPDPRIFRTVAEMCDAPLEGGWVVGSGPETDIAGAVATGTRSVWIQRGKRWPGLPYWPYRVAQTLCEAAETIVAVDEAEPG